MIDYKQIAANLEKSANPNRLLAELDQRYQLTIPEFWDELKKAFYPHFSKVANFHYETLRINKLQGIDPGLDKTELERLRAILDSIKAKAKRPNCTTENFKKDLFSLCLNCPLLPKIIEGINFQILTEAKEQKELLPPSLAKEYLQTELKSATEAMRAASLTAVSPGANLAGCTELYIWNKERIKALRYIFEQKNPAPFYWAQGIAIECLKGPHKDKFPTAFNAGVLRIVNEEIAYFERLLRELKDGRKFDAEVIGEYLELRHHHYDNFYDERKGFNYFNTVDKTAEEQKAEYYFEQWYGYCVAKFAIDFFRRFPTVSDPHQLSPPAPSGDATTPSKTAHFELILKEFIGKSDNVGGSMPLYIRIAKTVPGKDGGKLAPGTIKGYHSKWIGGKPWITKELTARIVSELEQEGRPVDHTYLAAIKPN